MYEAILECLNESTVKKWYHVSNNDFDKFDVSMSDMGTHFGSKEQANYIADNRLSGNKILYTVNLKVYKPLRLKDVGSFHADNIADQLYKKDIISKKFFDELKEKDAHKNRKINNQKVRDLLMSKGYDGIIYKNGHEGKGDSLIAINGDDVSIIKKEHI